MPAMRPWPGCSQQSRVDIATSVEVVMPAGHELRVAETATLRAPLHQLPMPQREHVDVLAFHAKPGAHLGDKSRAQGPACGCVGYAPENAHAEWRTPVCCPQARALHQWLHTQIPSRPRKH